MSRRSEVILAGTGGQGLVLGGMLLAEAGILEGNNVVQTVSYGIATRGGQSMAEVIIDPGEIIFQQVLHPDVIVAMSPGAMITYEKSPQEGTLLFYDTTFIEERRGENLAGFAFTDTAAKMGSAGRANIIALGFISGATGVIRRESLEEAIRQRFAAHLHEANLKALQVGFEAGAGVLAKA